MRGSFTYQGGMARRHEVFTAELLAMDRFNVEDLVAMMQDSTEDNEASSRTFSSSPCFLNSTVQGRNFPWMDSGILSLVKKR
jgi:hypothetical protein